VGFLAGVLPADAFAPWHGRVVGVAGGGFGEHGLVTVMLYVAVDGSNWKVIGKEV
jgi:hypothetical protein